MKKIRFFNMIEVTLAIAVVGIGISGIMALFPVAVQSTKDSIGDNYAPDVANMLLTYIAQDAKLHTNWADSSSWIGQIPTTKNTGDTPSMPLSPSNYNSTTKIAYNSLTDGMFWTCVTSSSSGSWTTALPKEFVAEIRVWKTQISGLYIPGYGETDAVPYTYGTNIMMEISWPIELKYDKRQNKRIYMLTLFNNNPT